MLDFFETLTSNFHNEKFNYLLSVVDECNETFGVTFTYMFIIYTLI